MDIDRLDEWSISYIHKTDSYNESSYKFENTPSDSKRVSKITKIVFGKNKKYYIKGNYGNRIKIYRNSKNQLRIINVDYDIQLNVAEQIKLMEKYSEDLSLPEWLAIRVFLYMAKNDWDDENIVSHLSVI
jgi:transcription initiation factor TFIIIB Brf1 subunit/transcription initiation factor TFIIB